MLIVERNKLRIGTTDETAVAMHNVFKESVKTEVDGLAVPNQGTVLSPNHDIHSR